MQRKTNGQFKKKSGLLFWLLLSILGLWAITPYYNTLVEPQEAPTEQIVEEKENIPLNEQDALKIENFKRKVIVDRKILEETQKHNQIVSEEKARHDSVVSELDKELEVVRQEELSFTKATPQRK